MGEPARRRFFNNGAFRLSYAFRIRRAARTSAEKLQFPFDRSIFTMAILGGASARFRTPTQNIFHDNIPWNDLIAIRATTNMEASRHRLWIEAAQRANLNAPVGIREDIYVRRHNERSKRGDTKNINYFVAGPVESRGWGRMIDRTNAGAGARPECRYPLYPDRTGPS